ncbi:MAG TPA: AAA family ATPase [Patescibacteria group bacterium]|jgi:predicted AAA+ superfamily ATPase|nr:AAA family ATPase [Patescibacteria group bacterium]
MIKRAFWISLIEKYWQQKNIIWLMGVRRIGKTSLCQSLDRIEYFDCERPRIRQLLVDPEGFLAAQKGNHIVLDEIHRLDNPSELLKLAADHYKEVKIIATGSSTLGASAKFKDTLTGRKKEIWLSPMLLDEGTDFGNVDLMHRFLFGGLPPFFANSVVPEDAFKEWIDAYWAKDIQDRFSVGKRYSFQKFAELLLAYSGGLFEATKFAAPCEVTRQTIANYLAILEETFIVHIIRPYSSHKPNEILMAPKVYGFDTGFICHAKGWQQLRQEDVGLLWEHCVLNELQAHLQQKDMIHYWRNKQGNEVDFVIPHTKNKYVTAIECKYAMIEKNIGNGAINAIGKNIQTFRTYYPQGKNFVVAHDISHAFERSYKDISLTFVNVQDLIKYLQSI